MAGRTGYTAITNGTAPNFGPHITSAFEHFDPLIGESVAAVNNLPSTGNWVGRTILVRSTNDLYSCTATPNSWKMMGVRGAMGNSVITSSTTVNAASATYVDTPLSVTFTAQASRIYKVTAHGQLIATVAGNRGGVGIREGSTILGEFSNLLLASVGSAFQYNLEALVVAPTAGTHTYKVSIRRTEGSSGNVNIYADSTMRAFLLVEDIGSSV